MNWSDLILSFLTPEGLIAILLAIVIISPYILFFFRKGILKQLVEEGGLATKKDLDDLRREQKADSNELRREVNNLRKAVLLLAQKTLDDPERLERINDLLTI